LIDVLEGKPENYSVVKLLLDAGADPNMKLTDGNTLLHGIAENLKIDNGITKMLLDAGADKRVKNKNGETPFFVALKNFNFRIAFLLAAN
jgi:ankyrin repeat protein